MGTFSFAATDSAASVGEASFRGITGLELLAAGAEGWLLVCPIKMNSAYHRIGELHYNGGLHCQISVKAWVVNLATYSVVRMSNPELLSDFSAYEAIENCFRAQGQFAGSTEHQEGVPKLFAGNQLASRRLHLCF